jgi:hypothetical protein
LLLPFAGWKAKEVRVAKALVGVSAVAPNAAIATSAWIEERFNMGAFLLPGRLRWTSSGYWSHGPQEAFTSSGDATIKPFPFGAPRLIASGCFGVLRRRPVAALEAPCIPTLATKPLVGPQWIHEIKHDGYRLIARLDDERVRLFTRRGYDWTERYPLIREAGGEANAPRGPCRAPGEWPAAS